MTEANKHEVAVFACGLPVMYGREKIYRWLKKFGYITKLDLPKGYGKGENRGYGYVHFKNPRIRDKLIREREFKFNKNTIIFEPYGDRRQEEFEKDFSGSEGLSFESEDFSITRSPSPALSSDNLYSTDSEKPTANDTIKSDEKNVIPDDNELVIQDLVEMLVEIKANKIITWQPNQNFCLEEPYFSSKKLFRLYHNFLLGFHDHIKDSNCGITVITPEIHDSYFSTIGNICMKEIIGL